jgi:transposase
MSLNNNKNKNGSSGSGLAVADALDGAEGLATLVQSPDPEVRSTPRRRTFALEYKRRIVQEAEAHCGAGQVAALLRREGLYSSHLTGWRQQLASPAKRRGRKPMAPALAAQIEINHKLEREKAKLERRLAQAETIIAVQKKLSELLGVPLDPPENSETE